VKKKPSRASRTPVPRVHLNRALSKLGILTRSQATAAILAGRVSVNGKVVRDPGAPIAMASARITVDQEAQTVAPWRTVLLHKPRGVVTTRQDPEGRRTVYSLLDDDAGGLVPVGRLDLATTGLLLLTSDTELAGWLTSPDNGVPRVYVATVRGRVGPDVIAQMEGGVMVGADVLAASGVKARKVSDRESHLTIELREGKNREVRRLCEAVGHEVTRLKRVAFGGLQLGELAAGKWRDVSRGEIAAAFPGAPLRPPFAVSARE
jgi:23S rRNA pseudouridine2605 synthase